jgi:hypothetical protein
MAQGLLPFQYEIEEESSGMTARAGLATYVEFCHTIGLRRLIANYLNVHGDTQGWTDEQLVSALLWLNICGGECVDDIRILESDDGLCRFMMEIEDYGRTSSERRALKRRWRKKRTRALPCPTSLLDYLRLFHDEEQEQLREPHKAFIPAPTEALKGLVRLIAGFIAVVQRWSPQSTATLDMDATLSQTWKKESLYCYKKYKAYQPLNIYWHEHGLVLHSEFRDGNVPANYDLLRVFKEGLDLLPQGVRKVFFRSDSAGYVEELLIYCAEGKSRRFGVIEFAVGADMTQEFKKVIAEPECEWKRLFRMVDGRPVDTGQEYAEVCFVPSWVGHKKHGPEYRFLAIREPLRPDNSGKNAKEATLPFPAMDFGSVRYKVTGLVTNRTIPGDEVIWWYRERCGKSEEAHSVMKEDLAGGKFPSKLFGANAAWWQIMILAFNVNEAMKRMALGGDWVNKRLKAVRFWLINVPGKVYHHARSLVIRVVGKHPSYDILLAARRRMLAFGSWP